MNMFPSVRNSVTDSVTRPGMAVRGIIKLIPDIRTIDVVGIYDFKTNESTIRFISRTKPKSLLH